MAPDVSVSALCKRCWLRHFATRRKVAGSIPDGVIGIFQVTLWSWNQIRIFPGDKGGRYVGVTTLPPSCADCHEILGASTYWNHQGLSRDCNGIDLPLLVDYRHHILDVYIIVRFNIIPSA
jgi:hypothetical protein